MIFINFTLLLLKFLTFTLIGALINNSPILKIIIIVLLLGVYRLLYNVARQNTTNVEASACYTIKNKYDLRHCWFMVCLYISIFVIGFFCLRLNNVDRVVNLKDILIVIYNYILKSSFYENLLNFSLVILLLFIYLYALYKIMKVFHRYFIRLHLYYRTDDTLEGKVYERFYYTFDVYIDLGRIAFKTDRYIFTPYIEPFTLKIGFINYHWYLLKFFRYVHYACLFTVILYDLIFNNYTLHYLYNVLPIIFVYEIYVRLCTAFSNLHLVYDYLLHDILYKKAYYISKNTVQSSSGIFSIRTIHMVMACYLEEGLDSNVITDEMLRKIEEMDEEDERQEREEERQEMEKIFEKMLKKKPKNETA